VTSGSWDGEKVFARDQVLEVLNVDGRLHVARKPRHHDGRAGLWRVWLRCSCVSADTGVSADADISTDA
jgi:hypothetical protein